jgi:aspartokinase
MGLRVVNSDMYFLHLMKRKGLSLKMPATEFEAREVARYAAKAVTDRRLETLVNARLGVIVDSTSGDQKKTTRIIKMLKKSGYDIKVVYIETTLEVAKARNAKRARTLPDAVVEYAWKGANKVKPVLKSLAGSANYHEIDNNKEGLPNVSGLAGKLTSWTRRLNGTALKWILAVKAGQDSMKTEDINTNTVKSFKDYTEALTVQQRMKMGRIAKRTAKKRARKAKIKAKRMKNAKEIQQKAAMMARNKLAKRFTGGKSISQLTVAQKIMLGKRLEKMKPKIAKLTKKLVKVARKAERTRIAKLRATKEHRIQ